MATEINYKSLEKFETVRRWITTIRAEGIGSDFTAKYYKKWLAGFCRWAGKTPDELVKERRSEEKSEDPTVHKRAEERLQEYCVLLEKEKGLKRSTALSRHSAVKSFYEHNYIPLSLKTPKRGLVEGVNPHTPEEIRELLGVMGPREKAMTLILAESGMSREDFMRLRYGDIRRDYEKGLEFIHLSVFRKKTGIKYDTFIGPNAVKALRDYLEMRRRKSEIIMDKTPLFTLKGGKPMLNPDFLTDLFAKLGKRAGIRSSPHRFRKFFETRLGMRAPSLLVRYWMGHSLGVERSYFAPSVEEQRQKYMEAYVELDIFKRETASKEAALIAMRNIARSFGIDPLKIKIMRFKDREPTAEEETEALTSEIGKIRRLEATAKVLKKERAVVGEEELENHLNHGWEFVATLPSGKVLIERDFGVIDDRSIS